jgi:5-enolpyruvylshikimate-3-phosphate synthase
MAKFGVNVDNHATDAGRAPQRIAPGSIDVEGDASAASYFAALATLHGARITLANLGTRTRQGDYAFFGCASSSARRSRATSDSTVIEGPRRLDAAFDGAGGHDQHARRRADADDDRAVPDRATRITGLATLAREGVRPHRRAHARIAQARRDGRGRA